MFNGCKRRPARPQRIESGRGQRDTQGEENGAQQSKESVKEERKMTGFIELTKAENGKKILLNVSKIEAVYPEEEGRGTFVSTESKSKREGKYCYGAFVKESYEEIKSKLEG